MARIILKRLGLTLASALMLASVFGGVAAAASSNNNGVHESVINISAVTEASSGHEYMYWDNGPNGGTFHLVWAIDSNGALTSYSMYATASLGNWSWDSDVNASTKLKDKDLYDGDLYYYNKPNQHNFVMYTGIRGGLFNSLHELPYNCVNLNRATGNAASIFNKPHWTDNNYVSGWSTLKSSAQYASSNYWDVA